MSFSSRGIAGQVILRFLVHILEIHSNNSIYTLIWMIQSYYLCSLKI